MKNFFQALKDLFAPTAPPQLGALVDQRTAEEQERQDVRIDEVVATSAAVTWRELDPKDVRTFGIQNQSQKSDCVAESRRKLKRILFSVNLGYDLDFSAVALYRQRVNYPNPGMIAIDAINIDKEYGMTLDALVPSDAIKNEAAANALKVDELNDDVAKAFRIFDNDIRFTNGDLDFPAATIQKTRKGVMMWFFFTSEEWSREVPVVIDRSLRLGSGRALYHSVVGVEPALYKGQEGIWIDDSAHFGGLHRRFITRDFYKQRNFWASYPMSFKFERETATDRPHYEVDNVVSLQDCLKYEGTFPLNIESTGYFGTITRQAVRDFQAKYGIDQVGVVGPITTAKLKELYP